MIRKELVADGVIGKVEVMNIRSLWKFRHIDRVEPLDLKLSFVTAGFGLKISGLVKSLWLRGRF